MRKIKVTKTIKKNNSGALVPLQEAKNQVGLAMVRLALLHLAFSRILVKELGLEKGKEAILKSIMEYGQLIGERIKNGKKDLPFYGVHDFYIHKNHKYIDRRQEKSTQIDYSSYKVSCHFPLYDFRA